MNPPNIANPGRFNPWPLSIIVFFAIAIAGCATFVTFCSRHPADLITANYYEDEVRYQDRIDRLQNTQAGAQVASVAYDAQHQSITISLPVGSPQTQPLGQIQLYRPSGANLDRQFKLVLNSNRTQAIDAASLAPGLWKVRVSWTVDGRDYFLDQQLVIPSRT